MKTILTHTKKGQINTLAPAIIALIIAAVFLVLGLIIVQSMRDVPLVVQAVTTTILNDTVNLSDSGSNVAQVGDRGANSFVQVGDVINASGGEIITSTNYTFSTAGVLTTVTTSLYNSTNVNVSYSYKHGDGAYESANKTIVGLGTFADFWEIIVLAIVITIIIGLLLLVFGRKQGR